MNVMQKLALKQILQNKKRTAITVLGIVLSVAMITSVLGFVISTHKVFIQTFANKTGDWHISFSGLTPEEAEAIPQEEQVGTYYTQEENGRQRLYFRMAKPGSNFEAVGEELPKNIPSLKITPSLTGNCLP